MTSGTALRLSQSRAVGRDFDMMLQVERLAVLAIIMVVAAACSAPGGPNRPDAPLSALPVLLAEADLVVIAMVESVSDPFPFLDTAAPVQMYEAKLAIEKTLIGRKRETVTVRVPVYYLDRDGEAFAITRAPGLNPREHVLLFLTATSPYADAGNGIYVTAGGGVVGGKFTLDGTIVRSVFREEPPAELADVERWLARPGG
jgi:hypothetical protein